MDLNTTLEVVQSDYGYNLNFALVNSDSSIFNLTGNTGILFKAQQTNRTALKFSGVMNVASASAGTCYYTVAAGNFPQQGIYNAQIQVSFISGIVTFPNIQITVIAKLPA